MKYMLHEGQSAVEFALPDQTGKIRTWKEFAGQWVLVYFYPKDDTPGCTEEACTIRDSYTNFQRAGVQVLGVSADSPTSHLKFAEKYHLPFTLLSDKKRELMTAYGALKEKSMFGKSFLGIRRSSFLIDPNGIIVKVYPDVTPADHAGEVLTDVERTRETQTT